MKIKGTKGRDTMSGSPSDDTIYGGKGADYLTGGQGDDTLKGGKGADLLYGSSGSDILVGGPGRDIFYFREYDGGLDSIKDFEFGRDQIVVDVGPGLKTLSYDDGDLFIYDALTQADTGLANVAFRGPQIDLRPDVDLFEL